MPTPAIALQIPRRPQPCPLPGRAPVISIAQQTCPNRLLRALPKEVWDRLSPRLELVELPAPGKLLDEAGTAFGQLYFPTNAIISLLCATADGAAAQTAMIGCEGMLGCALCMGCAHGNGHAVVQSPGYAFRLPAGALTGEFEQTPAVTRLLLRYTQSLIVQMAQTAVCNRHHTLEQHLCRWLLSSLDRLGGNDLTVTQEFISNLIGVRREGITEAAGKLQRAGLIRYSRGHIAVTDRPALEDRVCECYFVVRQETEQLLDLPRAN